MPAHSAPPTRDEPPNKSGFGRTNLSRRRFLGYIVAAPTLVVAAEVTRQTVFSKSVPNASASAIVSPPQVPEYYDLLDAIRDAARPTENLIKVEIKEDGTVHFAGPFSDNGQGIATSSGMIIAEELGIDPDQVYVTLADARPELVAGQLTGGSQNSFRTYHPIRIAAAIAKGALLDAAAARLGQEKDLLETRGLTVVDTAGKSIGFGELSKLAASPVTKPVEVILKDSKEFKVIGKERGKQDARAIVTGKKQFAVDLPIKDALPTVICRAPDLNGYPNGEPSNIDEVRSMPGVTDVAMIENGIAVRAKTFGQCIDAVNALSPQTDWAPGTVAGQNDEDVLKGLRAAELPLAVPAGVGDTIEGDFVFYHKSGSPLATNSAIADYRGDSLEIWGPSKSPIAHQKHCAEKAGLPVSAVTFHVIEGGGSFGRQLFGDAAIEATEASKAFGKPVRLMWTRADDSRQGRIHPMCTNRIRALVTKDAVASFEMRHTSVATAIDDGLAEPITAAAIKFPGGGNLSVSEVTWELTQVNAYNFGVNTRLFNEVDQRFNTSAVRNVYSPDASTAREVMVDQIANKLGRDPYEFRSEFIKHGRGKKVIDRCAKEADWGKSMPEGTAQGIGFHQEYKGVSCAIVEIDCRPETVNRPIRQGLTGPRVMKVTFVVEAGLIINPLGYRANMMGGINDAIAYILTAGLHMENGHFIEASWDNYFYTRQWNTPPEMNIIVETESEFPEPGGAGEFGMGATCGAVACAYARATGKVPEYFPILHKEPRPFEPYPTVPPIPPSPTDGLSKIV